MLRRITIVSEVFRPSTRTTSRRRATCPFRDIQRAFALHDTCYFNSSLPIVLKRWTGSVVPSPIFVVKAVYDTRGYALNNRSGQAGRHYASRSQIMHKRSCKLDPRRCRLCNSCHRFNHGCKTKKIKKAEIHASRTQGSVRTIYCEKKASWRSLTAASHS